MQGIPLIATSPVRHGEPSPGGGGGGLGGGNGSGAGGGVNGAPGGGMNPVEVHAFAPPWKALAEFALHNDLERIDPSAPHFQQLINQVYSLSPFPFSDSSASITNSQSVTNKAAFQETHVKACFPASNAQMWSKHQSDTLSAVVLYFGHDRLRRLLRNFYMTGKAS